MQPHWVLGLQHMHSEWGTSIRCVCGFPRNLLRNKVLIYVHCLILAQTNPSDGLLWPWLTSGKPNCALEGKFRRRRGLHEAVTRCPRGVIGQHTTHQGLHSHRYLCEWQVQGGVYITKPVRPNRGGGSEYNASVTTRTLSETFPIQTLWWYVWGENYCIMCWKSWFTKCHLVSGSSLLSLIFF